MKWKIRDSDHHKALVFIERYCIPDEETILHNNDHTFKIFNDYYDNHRMDLLSDSLEGESFRFKIRKRFYSNGAKFLELKVRSNDYGFKERQKLVSPEDDLECILENLRKRVNRKMGFDQVNYLSFNSYLQVANVSYTRSSYRLRYNTNVKVTLDSNIICENKNHNRNNINYKVLEIKFPFTEKVPVEVLAFFGINESCSKYVQCFR